MKYLLDWDDLSPKQREAAVNHTYERLIESISSEGLVFDGEIGKGIEAARLEVDRLQTPWFFGQAVHEKVGDLLMQLASSEAQEDLYVNPRLGRQISECVLPPA